jgi:nucleoid-associated protein YgaU
MVKYAIVAALSLAVLMVALWDPGAEKKESARGGDSATKVEGTLSPPRGPETQGVTLAPPPPSAPPPGTPAAPVVETPKPIDELAKYTVQGKESLRSIAKKWLKDEGLWKELLERNKDRIIDPDRLSRGSTLVFPRSKVPAEAEPEAPSTVPGSLKKETMETATLPASEKKYVVKPGDTLYSIASRELGKGTRWVEIARLNGIKGEAVRKGQTILIPAK